MHPLQDSDGQRVNGLYSFENTYIVINDEDHFVLGAHSSDVLSPGCLYPFALKGREKEKVDPLPGIDAAVSWPPLTSVDLGGSERAKLAAELLLKRIERPGRRASSVGVEPRLVIRESCGAAA